MSNKKPTWLRLLQTFAILSILVLFPIGSWYFLQKGFDYTKDKFEKLDSLGHAQTDTLLLKDSSTFITSDMEDHITLSGNFTNADSSELKIIEGLWKKFDDRKDFFFVFYDPAPTDYSTHKLFESLDFWKDFEQVKIVSDQNISDSEFKDILGVKKSIQSNEVLLIDTNMNVRGRYDLLITDERDLMISHIIFLLPKE